MSSRPLGNPAVTLQLRRHRDSRRPGTGPGPAPRDQKRAASRRAAR